MAKRALLVGSQIHNLVGCHNDIVIMQDLLSKRGFQVHTQEGKDATREGIFAGYRELIEDIATNDAAVVYYSGHGEHLTNPCPGNGRPDWLQFILPTDIDATTEDDFRGLFADELSLL